MDNQSVAENKYIALTPAGAYAIVSRGDGGVGRQVLLNILSESETPKLSVEALKRWSGLEAGQALTLLAQLQASSLVQSLEQPKACSEKPLEGLLPQLIAQLTDSKYSLLADPQGFYMASTGFEPREAEELAAISATLLATSRRHQRLFNHNLAIPHSSWALVDASGNSTLGFWPLHIGEYCFSLIMSGRPKFNHSAFVELVWVLSSRYANEKI